MTTTPETTPAKRSPIPRNIGAFILGWLIGSIVNMGIILASPSIVPLPEGVDPTDIDSIKANIDKFTTGNFIMPIIAHAAGTLVGAFVAAKVAASRHFGLAMSVGAFFLLGGIVMAVSLPTPPWVIATDLLMAYLPMAWLGWRLSGTKAQLNPSPAAH